MATLKTQQETGSSYDDPEGMEGWICLSGGEAPLEKPAFHYGLRESTKKI